MEDPELLRKVQAGDEAAFDSIFRTWYPTLARVATALVRDADTGEEVAQEVMLELWQRKHLLDAHVSLRGYLLRSVRNRALNHLRHRKVRQQTESDVEATYDAPAGSDEPVVAKELAEAIRIALLELPPRCREVFELSRVDGLRYAEIAEALHVSQKTVEAQMGKALRIMRARLAAWLPGGDTL